MSALLYRVRYFCSDAWDEWRHSKAVNMLALATLAAALFVAGLVMLVLSNVERRVQDLRDDVRVEVYLRDGHADDVRQALIQELQATSGVDRVEFVDKQEALRRYREWAADLAELVNELDSNPLPGSLEVYLDPGGGASAAADRIAASLNGRPAVEDVRFNQEWLSRLEGLLDTARVGGSGLTLLIFAAVIFVVASVLKLAVYARRDEIEIMRLVGAAPGFIRGPFLIAGAVQGLVASVVALALLEAIRLAVVASAGGSSTVLTELLAARPLAPGASGLLLLLGLLVGLAGSYFSVSLPREGSSA